MDLNCITYFLSGRKSTPELITEITEKIDNVVIMHDKVIICNTTSLSNEEIMEEYDKRAVRQNKLLKEFPIKEFTKECLDRNPLRECPMPRKSESQPWSKEARRRR